MEIIVVNDGSSDGTSEVAKKYEEKYPGIVKAVDKENGGHGDAVNTGLAHATGVYFKVVDSDDWVDEEALLKILSAVKGFVDADSKVDMLISNYVYEKVGMTHKKSFITAMYFRRIRCSAGMISEASIWTSIFSCIP